MMKVCVGWVKKYDKPNAFMVRQDLCAELIDSGIPEEVAQLICHQDTIVWKKPEMDGDVIFTAQILLGPEEC